MKVFTRRAAIMGFAIGCTALGAHTLVFSPWQEDFKWSMLFNNKEDEAKVSKLNQEMSVEQKVEELL